MASDTSPSSGRGVLAVAATALLVASAVAAGVSLTAVGSASAAPAQISECTTIDEPGTYELTSNVSTEGDRANPCFRITASDVTLDGNGHAVGTADTPAVAANGTDELTNVTVRGFHLRGYAVLFDGVSNGTVANSSVRSAAVPIPGEVRIVGDDNAVTGLTRAAQINVTGDDNRVVDSDVFGMDDFAVRIDGDGNLVRNVTATGTETLVVSGADNRVVDSAFSAAYGTEAAQVTNATGFAFANNSLDSGAYYDAVVTNTTESTFVGNELGLELVASDDNAVRNNTGGFSSSRNETVPLLLSVDGASDENTFTDNLISEEVSVAGESNLLYDNRITVPADGSFGEYVTGNNTWNVSARPGENVAGGDTLGGNYYVDDEGTGYSQTCEDADGDGFCDEPLRINENNVDYRPLAEPSNDTERPGNDSETNVTNYQVDFVAGAPIENLSRDRLYADQNRLLRFAFGNPSAGITRKDTAWPDESVRAAVDYGHIREHDDGTASVTFTVADGETVTLSLVTYSMPGEEFSAGTADEQELLNATTETYGPGEHTITVELPGNESDD